MLSGSGDVLRFCLLRKHVAINSLSSRIANSTLSRRSARSKAMWLMMAVAPAATLLVGSAHAANKTWVGGGGVDNTFTNAANWASGVIPLAGDTLIFDGNQD